MLLAGSEGLFRMESLTAQGTIISMHEKSDEIESVPPVETAPAEVDTGVIDPDAKG